MTDNELFQLFLPILQNQIPQYGYSNVIVKQSYQPTVQGINTAPTVYVYKVSDHRYGFLHRYDKWDTVNHVMKHLESQQYETKFALSALVLQNPNNVSLPTASDLVNSCAAIMQSDYARSVMAQSNVGILRIEDITNPYFVDDRDQFEAAPTLEFTLTHRQTRVITSPVIESIQLNINRV